MSVLVYLRIQKKKLAVWFIWLVLQAAGASFKINSGFLVDTMLPADLHDYPKAIFHAADQVIGRLLGDKEYRQHNWTYFVDEQRGETHFGKRDSLGRFSIGK